MELKFYFELLDKVDEMSFSNHDDKKRFVYIIRRIIRKMTKVWEWAKKKWKKAARNDGPGGFMMNEVLYEWSI